MRIVVANAKGDFEFEPRDEGRAFCIVEDVAPMDRVAIVASKEDEEPARMPDKKGAWKPLWRYGSGEILGR